LQEHRFLEKNSRGQVFWRDKWGVGVTRGKEEVEEKTLEEGHFAFEMV
jgi:hypothetical protein